MKRILLSFFLIILGLSGCALSSDETLYQAIRSDEPGDVTSSVERGAKINALIEDDDKMTSIINGGGKTSPLMMAASNGKLEAVKALLASGAHPNLANENGLTPLHLALGNSGIVRVLLEAGANPNAVFKRSREQPSETPLMRALKNDARTSDIELLLKHGAHPDFITPDGNSAMDIVDIPHQHKLKAKSKSWQILLRSGAKPRVLKPTGKQLEQDAHRQELEKSGYIDPIF